MKKKPKQVKKKLKHEIEADLLRLQKEFFLLGRKNEKLERANFDKLRSIKKHISEIDSLKAQYGKQREIVEGLVIVREKQSKEIVELREYTTQLELEINKLRSVVVGSDDATLKTEKEILEVIMYLRKIKKTI